MKKLPIGIQSFEKIRTDDYYYMDKTFFVSKLVSEGTYYLKFHRKKRIIG
ncbi:MAG TPA: AAA family ATPase [Defluviitoga tunisiensis]|nr:AAA family ATPase [Defluviitoga tunisiensis]